MQYLSVNDDTQRKTLARVLETLLQFTPEEKRKVWRALEHSPRRLKHA